MTPIDRITGLAPLPLIAAWALGCSQGDAAPLPSARVDTLAGGLVRVVSEKPTLWLDSTRAWKVVEVTRIRGEDGTAGELVQPGSLGVDDFGRVYVVDRKPAIIKVFDSTGALVRTIGREGAGPGEFRIAFMAVRGEIVAVHDPQQSRTSVFDTAGTFQRSWTSSCCFWDDIQIDTENRIYVPTYLPDTTRRNGEPRETDRAYTRYHPTGKPIDTLLVPSRSGTEKSWTFSSKSKDGKNNSVMMTNVPFTPQSLLAYHPDGGFVAGWSGAFRILRRPLGRDSTIMIERSWSPDPIPDPIRQAQVEDMVKNVKDMVTEATARSIARIEDVPSAAPAFVALNVDGEGNIWARSLLGSDSTKTRYDVFGPDGAWLGTLSIGIAMPEWGSQLFGRGVIYASIEDDDGRPVVVKLRVER
jgi:hypothetical protein